MDASSIITTLLSSSSIKGISKTANTTTDNVTSVLTNAVPALLQGASKQIDGAKTAKSFTEALQSHAQDDTSNITSFFKGVDLSDGAKIVSHLLGKSSDSTTETISKKSGVSSSTVSSVLSAAAPLLMSLLGKQTSGSSTNSISTLIGGLIGGGGSSGLTDLIGGLLGGSSSTKKTTTKAATTKKATTAKSTTTKTIKPATSKSTKSTSSKSSTSDAVKDIAGGILKNLLNK